MSDTTLPPTPQPPPPDRVVQCPLLLAGLLACPDNEVNDTRAATATDRFVLGLTACMGSRCAWWNPLRSACGMLRWPT